MPLVGIDRAHKKIQHNRDSDMDMEKKNNRQKGDVNDL